MTASIASDPARRTQWGRWSLLVGVLIALLMTVHLLGDAESPTVHAIESSSTQTVDPSNSDIGAYQADPIPGESVGHAFAVGCGILIAAGVGFLLARIVGIFAAGISSLLVHPPRIRFTIPTSSTTTRLRLCVARV